MPNGNMLVFLVIVALLMMTMLSTRALARRKKQRALREALHYSVGAYIPEEDATINHTSRIIYEVDDNGDYVLDAQGKKIKARFSDTFMLNPNGHYQSGVLDRDGNWTDKAGNKRIAKQDGLYQIRGGTGEKTIYYDDEGRLIRERRTVEAFQSNNDYWNEAMVFDNINNLNQALAKVALTKLGNIQPDQGGWVPLIYNLYSVGHNLIFKEDKKLFGEPALVFKEDAGNGRIIMAIVLSSGQIKVPNSRGATVTWEDVSLEDAIQVFTPVP